MSMFPGVTCRRCGEYHGPGGVCDNADCPTNQAHEGEWVRGELGPHWVDRDPACLNAGAEES